MADCELGYDASATAARDEEDDELMGPEGSGVARGGARSTLRLHTSTDDTRDDMLVTTRGGRDFLPRPSHRMPP